MCVNRTQKCVRLYMFSCACRCVSCTCLHMLWACHTARLGDPGSPCTKQPFLELQEKNNVSGMSEAKIHDIHISDKSDCLSHHST